MHLSFDYHEAIENIFNATEADEVRGDINDLVEYIERLQDKVQELTYENNNLQCENMDLNALVTELQNDT